MEQDLITYEDKVALDENPDIADINKVKDTDMNQIKNVINGINNGSQPLNNLVVNNIRSKNLLNVGSSFTVTSTQRQRDVTGVYLKAGVTYTLSCSDITSSNPYPYLFYFNVGQSTQFSIYLPNEDRSITFTPTDDVNSVRIYSSSAWNVSANYTTTYTNLMIEEGSTPTTYSSYKNFDCTGYVLWENFNPTTSFAGQSITLNDSIENYKYYEIIYIAYANNSLPQDTFLSTGKLVGERTKLFSVDHYSRRRLVSGVSGTNMTFGDGGTCTAYGTDTWSTMNALCVPYQVLGYK
jgi:hypothetical protein